MKKRILIAVLALLLFGLPNVMAARGWSPQSYEVERTSRWVSGVAFREVIELSTPYYTILHDLDRGGTISMIRLTHGQANNLLVAPIESRVQLTSENEGEANQQNAGTERIYRDIHDRSPDVTHTKSGQWETIAVEASLLDERGEDSGLRTKTIYTYRWGYIKVHKEIIVDSDSVRARSLSVFSTVLDPSLSWYGYRPGVRELMDPNLFSWRSGQIRQWGRIRPGTHFDLPLATKQLPRYLVFANHGVEGIEWFMADDLRQWDYQMTGIPGTGYCTAQASTDPLGVEISIYPVALSSRYELPKGGAVPLRGTYSFDYYIGIPILEGHAHNPWFNKSYAVNKGNWVTEEQIRKNAGDGVVTMHLHNDGDHHGDGLFWRDGSYPPYPAEEMKKMDQTIALIHKHGMKTAPYFSNHELHQSTDEFKRHGREWGRIVDDQGNLRPNYYYGAHMCLKSGWLDFLKFSIDRVLKNHDFDGVYYDWNIAMFCNNPLHVGQDSNGVSSDKGLGAIALSETAHWDMEELLELVEWTRARVGPEGIIILHNTLVPMFATENFANYVVGMEFSYGKLSVSVPHPRDLPLEWNFAGARPRTVIGYGTIARGAPQRLFKAHAVTTLMTSVAPWPVSDEAIELYKVLEPLGDLEAYQFQDFRNSAVTIDSLNAVSAVYSKPGEAYILLANLDGDAKTINCSVAPERLANPFSLVAEAELVAEQNRLPLDPRKLTTVGEEVRLPADGVLVLHIR